MNRDDLSEVEKQGRISRVWHSIRTRYSLMTAVFLLAVLAVFYIGGRIVLVHLVREAEQQVKEIGFDISRLAYRNAEQVRTRALAALSDFDPDRHKLTSLFDGETGFTLVVTLSNWGFEGLVRSPDGEIVPISAEEFEPYRQTLARWEDSVTGGPKQNAASGIMRLGGETHYVALLRHRGRLYMLGRRFDSGELGKVAAGTGTGASVTVTSRRTAIASPVAAGAQASSRQEKSDSFGLVPMLSEALDFYSGGFWDLGSNPFEAVFAVRDIAGNAVAMVTVSIPKTFTSVTRSAVGRLAFFIAVAGIFFVLPIFWFQSRVLLNPLTKMTKQIAELGRHNADTDCPRLEWKGKDEFALLAVSVNRMLETISQRSISVAQTEARHQALIDGLPDALAIFDPVGRLVAVSKEAESSDPVPGLVPGETPSAAVFGVGPVENFLRIIGEVFRDGGMGKLRLRVMRPIGMTVADRTRVFEIRLTRMDDYFALAIIRDISDEVREHRLRLAAEARVKDAEKRESLTLLAAGIAHDMNNVLSVVLGAAEGADADPSGDSKQTLSTIRDAVRRGSSMMRELMTFAGENRISLKRVKPALVIDDVKLLADRAVGRNVVIDYRAEADAPDVDADPNQFWKVLFNIVKNAGEALGTRPGSIRLSALRCEMDPVFAAKFHSARPLEPGLGTLFTIADDGPGIQPEMLPRIFDPYVSSKSVGRGLGLATVCTIVEAHGGGISVESKLDQGTVFSIYLPESRLPAVPAEGGTGSAPGRLPEEVLVVDDDESILKTTSMLLKAMGVKPYTATDNLESLAIVRRHAETLRAIVLDADLGGIDTVRLLGTFRVSAPGVRLIVSSGSAEEQILKLFSAEPYDRFLAKPYTLAELREVLV